MFEVLGDVGRVEESPIAGIGVDRQRPGPVVDRGDCAQSAVVDVSVAVDAVDRTRRLELTDEKVAA